LRFGACVVGLALLGAAAAACSAAGGGGGDVATPAGGRVTVTIALVDDAARRAAAYAIEQGIEPSDTVDLAVSYLPPSALDAATSAGQYDIVEASPLALVAPGANDLGLRLLSLGELDSDGTLLFTRTGSDFTSGAALDGESVGIASTTGVPTLEARYVLRERYGLNADAEGGDVTLREAPSESQVALLRSGELAAAIPPATATFAWVEDAQYRVANHLAQEYAELTGSQAVQTALVVKGDLVNEQPAALLEVARLLAASSAYERANRDQVTAAVTGGDDIAAAQLRWWWQTHELRFGSLGEDDLRAIGAVWSAARDLGDIDSFPEPASLAALGGGG
jgi:hypothetical protein